MLHTMITCIEQNHLMQILLWINIASIPWHYKVGHGVLWNSSYLHVLIFHPVDVWTDTLCGFTPHSTKSSTAKTFVVFAWTANVFLQISKYFGTCGHCFDVNVKVFPQILTWWPNCKSFVPQKFVLYGSYT